MADPPKAWILESQEPLPRLALVGPGVTFAVSPEGVWTATIDGGGSTSPPENTFYVSMGGSDSTGDGSPGNPFATYAKAASVATTNGAASGNSWVTLFTPGTYAENIQLYPFVSIASDEPIASNGGIGVLFTGTISLHAASWSGAAFLLGGMSDCVVIGNTDIDFLSAASTGGNALFYNVDFSGTFHVEGTGAVNNIVACINCFMFGGDTTISDADFSSDFTQIDVFTLTAPTFGASWQQFGGTVTTSVAVNGTAHAADVEIADLAIVCPVTLTGTHVSWQSDVIGVGTSVTLVGGAPPPVYQGSGSAGLGFTLLADGSGNWTLSRAASGAYAPAVPGNWAGAAPTTIAQALDRIAANTTNTHPIP